jgi:cytochrome c oxidase subunit 2
MKSCWPLLAQIQLGPGSASNFSQREDMLFLGLMLVTGSVLFIIAVFIIYFLAKYRRRAWADRSNPVNSAVGAETTWTVLPFLIFLGFFGWGADIYLHEATVPVDAVEIGVIGKQWMWKLQHLEGNREIDELHVPVNKNIKLLLTSQDVIHSFSIPAFRVKQDVLPGRYTTEWFRPTRVGTYMIYCNQYCGAFHANMIGKVVVMSPQDYASWLKGGQDNVSIVQTGANLFHSLGCSGCHSPNPVVRAPILNGVYGSQVPLQDGRVVLADESYIRDCILAPNVQVPASYQPVMPSFAGRLSEEQLFALVTYVKSLRDVPAYQTNP